MNEHITKPPNIDQIVAATKTVLQVNCEGRGLFDQKSPLPRAPSRKDYVWADSGGEAASLREAPLPQTPSPEERFGNRLGCFFGLARPMLGGRGFLDAGVEITAG